MTSTTCKEPSSTTDPGAAALSPGPRGRAYTKPAKRDSLLAQYDQSDLSARQFAEQLGINHATFRKWLTRRKHREDWAGSDASTSGQSVAWLEAVMQQVAPASNGGLVLVFPSGVRAEFSSVANIETAAALMRALEKPC